MPRPSPKAPKTRHLILALAPVGRRVLPWIGGFVFERNLATKQAVAAAFALVSSHPLVRSVELACSGFALHGQGIPADCDITPEAQARIQELLSRLGGEDIEVRGKDEMSFLRQVQCDDVDDACLVVTRHAPPHLRLCCSHDKRIYESEPVEMLIPGGYLVDQAGIMRAEVAAGEPRAIAAVGSTAPAGIANAV